MQTIKFMTSLLTFYMKGEIKHEQNAIKLKSPNTILGFIPLGAQKATLPVPQIASVDASFRLLLPTLLAGLFMCIVGLGMLFSTAFLWGLIVLPIGASNVINAFQTALVITMTSGEERVIFFLVFEKEKAETAEQQINTLISQRYDDTNTRIHTENAAAQIVGAISELKNNQ